jgi:hydroxyethylthiazole kinase-like uncharacterized protein yjeF
MILATASQMQELDRRAINEWGIPGVVLMENAGRLTYEAMIENFEIDEYTDVLVVSGKGNNGGDGFVIARHLFNNGIPVKVALLAEPSGLKGDALVNFNIIKEMRIDIAIIDDAEKMDLFNSLLDEADVVVDAIFGTGLDSEVGGHYAQVIEAINEGDADIVSVDIPSGLSCDSGSIMGDCIVADLTVTYGLAKIGQVIYPGAEMVGDLVVVDISLPRNLLLQTNFDSFIAEPEQLFGIIPQRLPNDHKGSFGHLLIVAGSPGKTGAAAMSAQSSLRSGAGLVTLGVPSDLNPILETKLTEEMTVPLPQTDDGLCAPEAFGKIMELLQDKSALVLGPGLGQGSGVTQLVPQLIREIKVPTLIDADGLNALIESQEVLKEAQIPLVITPHPGEMARLTGKNTDEVQADRVGVAREFALSTGAVVVLKGARTVIADSDGTVFINISGNPGMASAGTGDVLSGIIGGLMAQGVSPLDAAVLGTYLHGRTGDLAEEDVGEVSLTATDLLEYLPDAIQEVYEMQTEID